MLERFTILRAITFLRRISRELHRANELESFRLSCEFPTQYFASKFSREPGDVSPKSPRLSSITHPSVESWNDSYRKLHPPDIEED